MSYKNEDTLPQLDEQILQITQSIKSKPSISFDDFETKQIIGSGSFSTVKLATFKQCENPHAIALKIIPKSIILKKKNHEQLKGELRILEETNHPFIIQFIRSFQNETSVCFVFEFVNGGELFNLLSAQSKFNDNWIRFYLSELLVTLRYLHSKHIVYRDLKSENVLIDNNGHIKLIDFGFSKKVDIQRAKTLCGTPEYMAPEILMKSKSGYGCSIDYWALGILAYEMSTGTSPFSGDSPTEIFRKILKPKTVFPSEMSSDLKSLISGLLCVDPMARLGSNDVI